MLEAQLALQQEQIKKLTEQIVNIGAIQPIVNINVHFHGCEFPYVDELVITRSDLQVADIGKKVIEMIYFNKDFPQNHTLYLPNIKENRLLVYRKDSWENVSGNDLTELFQIVLNCALVAGGKVINNGSIYTNDTFHELGEVLCAALIKFNNNKCSFTDAEFLKIIRDNKHIVEETLKAQKVIKRQRAC